MGLKKCNDCGNEVSKSAANCPKCGKPIRKPVGALTTIVVLVGLLWVVGSLADRATSESPKTSTTRPQAENKKEPVDEELQSKRLAFLQKLLNEGIFIKIDTPGTLPRVHVGPKFHVLDFETKQKFVEVVYAYHFPRKKDDGIVRVFDGQTNHEIGTYHLNNPGLKLQR